jgi:hypothetical protein
MKALKYLLLIVMFSSVKICFTQAQGTKADKQAAKVAAIKKLIDSKKFVFVAQYANPIGGGITSLNGRMISVVPNTNGNAGRVYLSSSYDVTVRPDSVITYLPYFGTAQFDAGYNPTDGGIKFTSTKFGYATEKGKKGFTQVTVTPTDAKYNQKMTFNISPNGEATLSMNITNKSFISYDGYIAEKP